MATFNPNELIIDKVRSLTGHDLATGEMIMRLTSLEDPTLTVTSEGEEITDAIGALITTLYRGDKASFSATNSLWSIDLAASQLGSKKQVASSGSKIVDYIYEVVETPTPGQKITLKHVPIEDSIKFIYAINNNELGTSFKVGSVANATDFVLNASAKQITPPTGFKGKLYIEYQYEAEKAIKFSKKIGSSPEAMSVVIYALFRDKCNENLIYSGKIICRKAKLNPEQVELAFNSGGKHPFEFKMVKDYCADEGDDSLFDIIISEN